MPGRFDHLIYFSPAFLAGATVVAGISISPWAHYDAVSAVEWGGGVDSVWMQNHVNRMDECGISGGTPLVTASASAAAADIDNDIISTPSSGLDSIIPLCKMHVKLDMPLVLVTGAGSFYNFYNEDAMGTMVAGSYQGPNYRYVCYYGTMRFPFIR